MIHSFLFYFFFFFNDTATTEIYTLSLHDALPICGFSLPGLSDGESIWRRIGRRHGSRQNGARSEEHTSELQSLAYLVCRLLLEKKKNYSRHTVAAKYRQYHIFLFTRLRRAKLRLY